MAILQVCYIFLICVRSLVPAPKDGVVFDLKTSIGQLLKVQPECVRIIKLQANDPVPLECLFMHVF